MCTTPNYIYCLFLEQVQDMHVAVITSAGLTMAQVAHLRQGL